MTDRTDREARLAAQLRANLVRRKQAGGADAPASAADQRANAIDPSDVAAPAA